MRPFPFQIEGLRAIDYTFDGRSLIAWDMGLGKTLTTLWYTQRRERWPALVVCPSTLKWVWEREARRIGIDDVAVIQGRGALGESLPGTKLTIINYDVLSYWKKRLTKKNLGMLIFDECQFLKNHTAKRTKAARSISRKSRRLLALSGTPILNRPIELWPVLNMIDPIRFNSRFRFAQRYCDPKSNGFGMDYSGASNIEELNELLLDSVMIRKRKLEVIKELPQKMRQVVPIDMENPIEYERADDDFIGWLQEVSPDKVQGAKKAKAVVKVGELLRLAARLKLKATIEWVNNFLEDGDKIVLFARHKFVIKELHNAFHKSVVVDGSVTGKRRMAAVDKFQKGNANVLIGQIDAAGVGLTLTAAADVAFIELPWQPGAVTQAEDRCWRIGQDRTVWIHYLVAVDTIEERLCSILQDKQEVVDAILDGKKVDGSLDVWDLLLRS